VNFLLRPVVILQLVEMHDGVGFQQSVYWTTVQFTQAMISIMIALNLMVAVAVDLLDELRREAKIDKLSGLLNRKGFEVEAADMLARYAHAATPACLLLADLDHFKEVNDTYGHAAGDAVISVFGAAIRSAGPETMVAGRIGGEEFAMLLVGVELGDARNIAEDIRITLSEAAIGRLPPGLTPTASIGVQIAPARAGLSELLRHADLSLYQAKRAGRNRVEVSAPALAAAAV
jgi:diguanylate cyclase (GGDEF)-like protein